jgi:hypothetical protein
LFFIGHMESLIKNSSSALPPPKVATAGRLV